MWTPTALACEARTLGGKGWRAVEYQHTFATRRLVASQRDQELLEEIVEGVKPPLPPEAIGLDYLLATPFRYDAPYPVGSRFRPAGPSEGVFYASETSRTALAELSHYRMRFFRESPDARLPVRSHNLTVFAAAWHSEAALDWTEPPLDRDRVLWTHPQNYSATQQLAASARAGGVEVIRYESVRDRQGGINLALLTPAVFTRREPVARQTWSLYLTRSEATCERVDASGRTRLHFPFSTGPAYSAPT